MDFSEQPTVLNNRVIPLYRRGLQSERFLGLQTQTQIFVIERLIQEGARGKKHSDRGFANKKRKENAHAGRDGDKMGGEF